MEADDEVFQSLKTGKTNSCWDYNSRFLLRLTLHITITCLLLLILVQMVLFSVFYYRISEKNPITISPYGGVLPSNNTLVPCVYPRIIDPLPGDTYCPSDTYCPPGWACSIVSDEETQANTYVCLNTQKSCGDLHFCSTYIRGLDDTNNTTFPAKIVDIGISETFYLLAVIPTFFCLLLLCFMWLAFNFWNVLVNDPFNPRSVDETTGVIRTIYEKYQKVTPSNVSSWRQCQINICIFLPLLLILVVSGSIFIAGASPSLDTLTQVAASDCFVDHWLYLFSSSVLGWITGFFVAEILFVLCALAFLSMYTVKPLYQGIWDPRVFLTIAVLVFIIMAIGVTIELVSIMILALT